MTDEDLTRLEIYCKDFWDSIIMEIDDVKDYANNNDALRYRNENGGNLLFRSKPLECFVNAVCRIKIINEISFNLIAQKMNGINLQLDSQEWGGILWDRQNRKMIIKDSYLVELLLMHYFDDQMTKRYNENELLSLYARAMQITPDEAASRLHISEV
jgi:hypothetical protein